MSHEEKALTPETAQASSAQKTLLTLLRVAIGWHFLYEGTVKLLDPHWSSAGYLAESKWVLSGFFNWIVLNPPVLKIVDILNVWGLILIGLGLFFGCLTRAASISGVALLLLYYVANPPFIVSGSGLHTEGNYLFVDKNLVEMLALGLLAFFPAGAFWGLDSLLARKRAGTPEKKPGAEKPAKLSPAEAKALALPVGPLNRREIFRQLSTLPIFGGFVFAVLKKRGWESFEERHLLAARAQGVEAVTSATVKTFQFASLKELKGQIPAGRIGNLQLSRLILGGNLIGGWAHSRDLIYVSKLIKSYHTDQKVFDTFRLAEKCGINTILTNPVLARVINAYWRREGGKIQFISDSAYERDIITGIKMSVDGGAHACYVQGGFADRFYQEGKLDEIGKAVDFIRQNGLPAGIGAHKLETVKACVERGFKPDFWVKTLHHIDYWSARPKDEECDNIWCTNPEDTVAYMNQLEEPWIAYKILAAGAIEPSVGFPYAFQSGADFIAVGMYDFQIVEDANLAFSVLAGDIPRNRPWRA